MPEPKEESVWLDMPPAFIEACNSCHIEPQKALQIFIDLSVCVHLKRRSNTAQSLASVIFNGHIEERSITPEPDYAKRPENIQYIRQLVCLIESEMSVADKQAVYKKLLGEWYDALQ